MFKVAMFQRILRKVLRGLQEADLGQDCWLEKEVGVARVWLLQLLKVQKGTGRWNRAVVTSVG